jgi:SAM-dependent methyltransferase
VIVILSNVLEHIADPLEVLASIKRVLTKGGFILIVVPNVGAHLLVGQLRKLLKRKDPFMLENDKPLLVGFDPPIHLTSFSPKHSENWWKRQATK